MSLQIVNANPKYSKVGLGEPTSFGYIYIAATVQPGLLPLVLPSPRRAKLIKEVKELAIALERHDQVVRISVFRAVAIPPTERLSSYLRKRGDSVRPPRFDVLVLVETKSPEAARSLMGDPAYQKIIDALKREAKSVHVVTARNAKRIGDVPTGGKGKGLFLFNHFVADDPSVGMELWDYLADWFAVETGLDNSAMLVPLAGEKSDYTFINEARLDQRLPVWLWHQLSKKTFRSYVLANLEANRVGSMPVFYQQA